MTVSKIIRPLLLASLVSSTALAGPFDKLNQSWQRQKDRLNQQVQDTEVHLVQTRDHIVQMASQDGIVLW